MGIFEELGIKRYINAQDTFTIYGGSCMEPAALKAMAEVAESFVELSQVQKQAGDAIARLTRNEGAYICNGASGGLALSAAVCMSRGQEAVYRALPDTGKCQRNEIVIQKSQEISYEKAITLTGAKIVQVGKCGQTASPEELEEAICERTAAVFYFTYHGREHTLPLLPVIEIAHKKGVPVVVDAAAAQPPASNLWAFTQMGADMVIFSGGKSMRGPQDSGLIVGKRVWTEACRTLGFPADGIGRCLKTSREAMVGLYVAVKIYLQREESREYERLEGMCRLFIKTLDELGISGAGILKEGPVGQTFPRVSVRLPGETSPETVVERMKEKGIYIGMGEADGEILLNPLMVREKEMPRVCGALKECLETGDRRNG